uniref:Exodeoxyribonuclease VII, small subunit n=1 Tax=mine drainage metagenome TaxID=410659 RepID=E6Q7V4_9ZZZZ
MNEPGESFEQKLARIDAIVKELANEQTTLDRGVALFQEGRALITACETLLKGAQEQVDASTRGEVKP